MESSFEKNAQTITNLFENLFKSSKRKPNLLETDDGSEFVTKKLTKLLNSENIEIYSRSTSLGAVFAERPVRSYRDLLESAVFEKVEINSIDILPTITRP